MTKEQFEGHDNWQGTCVNMTNEANKRLIAAAPNLLANNKRLHIILEKMMQNMWSGFDEWLWLHQEKMCHGLWKPCPYCEGDERNEK